jgi:uncharacterized protein YjbJ (UPF0337 family)
MRARSFEDWRPWNFPPSCSFSQQQIGEKPMDRNRVKGSAEQAKGKVKELAGKATGDKKLEAEGKANKAGGKIRSAIGGLKDALRGK